MIGKKIKKLRIQLGVSQKQLAGNAMSRAYISLIENGHVTPSNKAIQLIAERLGIPVEQLLETNNNIDICEAILKGAHLKFSNEEFESCEEMINQLLTMTQEVTLITEAYLLKIRCNNSLKKHSEVLNLFDDVLFLFLELGDKSLLTDLYLERGRAAFDLENFNLACKSYEYAIKYSDQLKRLQDRRITALTYLGTTFIRLGKIKNAISAYLKAEKEANYCGDKEKHGNIALGLGKAYFIDKSFDNSLFWAKKALQLFKLVNSDNAVLALHNLAIIQSNRNFNDESFDLLSQCFDIYKQQNKPHKQASILDEITHYWIKKGELEKAKECCKKGIKLLEIKEDGILRARFYRSLGIVYSYEKKNDQSYYFLRMSYDLFTRLNSLKEASISMSKLKEINFS